MECRRLVQIFLPVVFLLLSCGQSSAVIVDNLYTVVIQVTDNTIATRNQNLPQAFDQVIKKVASSHKVLKHPEYTTAKEHLDRFVSNYFYTENGATYTLTLRFNEQMINHLLTKIGRNTLGKNRPQILLWLVTEQNNIPQFVTHGPQAELANKIDSLSANYGVPIILPLVDLTERLFIKETDVINFNVQPLLQAAERYSTDTILIGKINNLDGTLHCEWRLVDAEHNFAWNSTSKNLDEELELMLNSLADQLVAHKNTLQESTPKYAKQGINVRVQGVKSVADYAKVLEHLKRLSSVQQVEIGSVEGSHATFLITVDGGKDALLNSLKMSNVLFSDPNNLANSTKNNNYLDLIYRISS